MLMTALSILLVLFFLAMNAFFVVAEFALVRVRRSQLDLAVAEGRKGARAADRAEVNAPVFLAGFANGVVPFPFSDGRQNSMIVKFRCETIHP